MTPLADDDVFVEVPARLHFGVLDLRGSLGRRFGGIGAAAPGPTLLVSAAPADVLEVNGPDADRVAEFARRFLAQQPNAREAGGARIRVHRVLPSHVGLGSGTQLALATACALAELRGTPTDAPTLSHAVGRAQRSAIGTWTFAGGGLVLEGGRRSPDGGVAPLLARLPFPPSWHCVVVVPDAAPGISGSAEATAFAQLPAPSERDVERVAHLVLMALLPAVADGDLATFGAALSAVQTITGRWFAPVQGGTFAPGPSEALVRRLAEWGASGVGQSSWGPAVYGIAEGAEAGARLAERARDMLGGAGAVYEGAFPAGGARVWRAPRSGAPGLAETPATTRSGVA